MERYDRKLARAVYAMVLLAILAMVLAEGAVVYFAVACLAALISWPIAHGRTGQSAVPRWLISLAVLLALGFFFIELLNNVHLVSALAHFMIFVQVCKFFENKRSRDYGQLIVLSMLEMVVAAILSSSLLFGVLLVVYLALGIYTLLLFHFKREIELFEHGSSKRIHPAPGALASAAAALGGIPDRRFWRMSATTGGFALAVGIMLFLCFPRVGEGLLGRAGRAELNPLTGFTETPRLGDIGKIKQSDELVMWVTVLEDGHRRVAPGPLLLRGVASWRYHGGRWRPLHDRPVADRSSRVPLGPEPRPAHLVEGLSEGEILAEREIRVELGPLESQCLFAPYPVLAAAADTRVELRCDRTDWTLSCVSPLHNGLRYSVWQPRDSRYRPPGDVPRLPGDCRRLSVVPRAGELARQWTAGLADDLARASAIESRLRREFSYTLDLPATGEADPLETFLFETRAGHCQYFASAMTVMCQQLNIPARMISGFKAVEYNQQGGYYIVRQKHAHSWVEVFLAGQGWLSFDPTPAAGDDSFEPPGGLLGWLAHTMDYMNYTWQQRVVNYSRKDREAFLSGAGTLATSAWRRLGAGLAAIRAWPVSRLAAALALTVGLAVLALAITRARVWEKWGTARHRRILRERGLGFWADLLMLLERHGLVPPPALTPLEITRGIAGVVPEVDGLTRMAMCYYKVRYGSSALEPPDQTAVRDTLSALSAALAGIGRVSAPFPVPPLD